MPTVFEDPRSPAGEGETRYLGVAGEGAIFGLEKGVGQTDVTDGLSNTIMLVEADRPVIWTKPEDWNLNPDAPLQGPGNFRPSGFIVLLSDGGVKFILITIDSDLLRGLMTINGGEAVSVP